MSQFKQEDEQWQAFKAWWQKYGTAILSVTLVGVVAWSGWTYWQNQKLSQAMQGSATFEMVQAQAQQGQLGEVLRDAKRFMQAQPESPYAAAIAFLIGQNHFDQAEYDQALSQYDWVVKQTPDASLRLIAHLRASQVYLQQGAYAKAQSQLDQVKLTQYGALQQAQWHLMQADIAWAQSQWPKAKQSLEKVLSFPGVPDGVSKLAQMKLSDLAGV